MSGLNLSASSLIGDNVVSKTGEDVGNLKEIMVDTDSGRVSYAVLSFGGFLGFGDKLFAVPWSKLIVDRANSRLVLDVDKETLDNGEGFDKDNWPNFADTAFRDRMYSNYKAKPYWS